MSRMEHLLAATDLSPRSLYAVDRGFLLAGKLGAAYSIVHALELDALAPLRNLLGTHIKTLSQQVAQDAHAILTPLLEEQARKHGLSAVLRLEQGEALTSITTSADAVDADLVLLGAHGSGFVQELLFGSIASRVLRTSRRPVLAVKQPAGRNYQRVLVAADLSPASEHGLRLAMEIAYEAEIILLNVFELPFERKLHHAGITEDQLQRFRRQEHDRIQEQLHSLARQTGLKEDDYRTLVLHGDASQQILAQGKELDCDLIVLGKHGMHVTEELLLGSVTKHILARSGSDVLVVAHPKRPARLS